MVLFIGSRPSGVGRPRATRYDGWKIWSVWPAREAVIVIREVAACQPSQQFLWALGATHTRESPVKARAKSRHPHSSGVFSDVGTVALILPC